MSNDNRWYQMEDGPKFKNCKLINIVKIGVNTILLISIAEICLSFWLISITRDDIWFLITWVKTVSSK